MDFEITHITDYNYQNAAAEAYLEARLTPPDLPTQTVKSRRLIIEPATKVSGYFGLLRQRGGVLFAAVPAPFAGHHEQGGNPDARPPCGPRRRWK